MKKIIFISTLFLISCTKTKDSQIEKIEEKPVFISVTVDNITSETVVVR